MTVDDATLWRQWQQQRDPDAFAEIVSRHAGMVYATCRRILGNATEAEDAAQDCFIELLNGRVSIHTSLAPWLYTVAVRRALNRAKAETRRRQRDHQFMDSHEPAAPVVLDDLVGEIDAALVDLPEKLRTPVVRHFLEGRNYEAIAQDAGVAESTIRYRTNKGIERIRAALKRRGIPVTAVAVTAVLDESMAEAAPLGLTATLGKLAVAGATASIAVNVTVAGAALKTLGGILIMKKLAVGVLVIAAILAGIWGASRATEKDMSPDTPPMAARSELQVPTPVMTVSEDEANDPTGDPAPLNVAAIEAPEEAEAPPEGIRVAGIVVDQAGEPVADARVLPRIGALPRADTRSSADGTFELRIELICNQLTLAADKGAFESQTLGPLKLRDEGLDGLVLRLDVPRTARIGGTVVNQKGEGLPDLSVSANRTPLGATLEPVRTNALGQFDLANLAPGDYSLTVAYPEDGGGRMGKGLANVTLREGQAVTGVELLFQTGELAIAGRVTDTAGKPIVGANVHVHNGFGGDVTDEDGHFTIVGLEEGALPISATHADYSWTHLRNVAAGTEDLQVIMKGKGGIEGRVLRSDSGEPVTDFEVFHVKYADQGLFQNRRRVRDPDGRFALTDLDADEVTVTVRGPGLAPSSRQLTVEEHKTLGDITLKLEPGEHIEGVVENASGMPVLGAYLYAGLLPLYLDGGAHLARSGGDGRFTIEGWPADATRIAAYHPDYAPAVAEATNRARVRIIMQAPGVIEGTVVQEGKPVAAMLVMAIYHDGQGSASYATTGADGSYRLEGLAPGTAQVIVNGRGMRDGKALMEMAQVEAGAVTRLDFEFKTNSASLEGIVSVDGQPVGGAHVLWLSHATVGVRPQETETAADGLYRFDAVQAGDSALRVVVTMEDGRQVMRNIRVDIGEGETLRQDVDISLSPGQQITGQVFWDTAEGLDHGVVVFDDTVTLPDVSESLAILQQVNFALSIAECAEDGSYTLTGLEPGHYTVLAMERPTMLQNPKDIRYAIAEVTLTGEEPAVADFDFRK